MTQFIAIKIVNAVAMAVAIPNQYASMSGQTEGAEGYEVTYEDGYKSWSPKDTFEAANSPITKMGFPEALHMMLQGHKVACTHWNTYFMRVELGTTKKALPPLAEVADGTLTEYPAAMAMEYDAAQFDMTTEELEVFNGWHPNHHDMQCKNWYVWTQADADARKAFDDAQV